MNIENLHLKRGKINIVSGDCEKQTQWDDMRTD